MTPDDLLMTTASRIDPRCIDPTEMTYAPPTWLVMDIARYRRMLNRQAVAITKRDKKRGGTYQVKEAMDAIHAAFHCSDGSDPYDGMPLDGGLFNSDGNGVSNDGRHQVTTGSSRLPTVAHRHRAPIAEFEIVSWQTNTAMGDLNPEEYIAHCRAVAAHADKTK